MIKIILLAVPFLLSSACNLQTSAEKYANREKSIQTAEGEPVKGVHLADAKYVYFGKSYLETFSRGDINAWLEIFADNAVFQWNNGDSLTGKDAIAAYWSNRWSKLDSIRFSNQIWLPVRVTQPQSVEQPGVWLLAWYQFDATYKGNIKVRQWAHDGIHFDANDRVDRLIHYVDMGPIMRAVEGKKDTSKKAAAMTQAPA